MDKEHVYVKTGIKENTPIDQLTRYVKYMKKPYGNGLNVQQVIGLAALAIVQAIEESRG